MEKNDCVQEKKDGVCRCGSPLLEKEVQVGWGHKKIHICSNPDCPCKKKNQEENQKQRIGWGE